MMTYLHIQGFRSLQDLRLTGFTRVNLLLGAHGVGKTSALEAIALWARAGALRASLFRPGESSRDDLDVRHLFHGRVLGTQEIRVTAEWSPPDGGAGTPAEVRIRHVPSMTGTTLPVLRIRAGDQEQEVPLASDGTLPSGFPMHSKPFAQSLAVATGWAVFHAGAALVAADMVRPLAEMVPREEEADILQLVQMADPTITAICARDDGVMHVTQDGQAVPLASVGEGVRRLLFRRGGAAPRCDGLCDGSLERVGRSGRMAPLREAIGRRARQRASPRKRRPHDATILRGSRGYIGWYGA